MWKRVGARTSTKKRPKQGGRDAVPCYRARQGESAPSALMREEIEGGKLGKRRQTGRCSLRACPTTLGQEDLFDYACVGGCLGRNGGWMYEPGPRRWIYRVGAIFDA